ncbi:competence-damage inducible protein CinA [Thermacetogenium phaeum DSM 12270]|uniref:Putative competence-damage inducible protein n=2 Tax=Thermacetogenium phaeum TaxID=85874 RepID=K4LEX4_THEPS|nr:competence-damage inducible protein CinA [Thermacetogenium phaeum DSM 12270]
MKMAVLVEIIATGDELLIGEKDNTTTPFLVRQVALLGYEVRRTLTVSDNLNDIAGAVREALHRADLIFVTGGLGPTPDDVTREAVAEAIKRPLEFRSDIWEEIQAGLLRRSNSVPPSNMKQAYLPCGAEPLSNCLGTAPGFIIPITNKTIVVLPGPPGEAREMFLREVKQYLSRRYPPVSGRRVCVFKTCGPGEAVLLERLKEVLAEAKKMDVGISFLPQGGEVHLVLKWNDSLKRAGAVEQLKERLMKVLGEDLYGLDEDTLPGKVGELLSQNSLTVGVAESCTGGLVANYLTDVPGSSRYVRGGVVAYTEEVKMRVLGVQESTLNRYGAVSLQTAKEMAEGVRRLTGASIGLATTGFAGPEGGTPDDPVGTVYLGLATRDDVVAQRIFFPGLGRITVKSIAAKRALDLLRRYLLSLSEGGSSL